MAKGIKLEDLSKWYVYELIDPRNNEVFYVGKGCGNRINNHEQEAAKGVCSKKTNKIKSIVKSGHKISKRKIAFFWDEQAAYDHETDVISSYGLENLTNIMRGGQVAFERRVKDREVRKANDLHVWLAMKGSEVIYERFAQWFRSGLHNNGKSVRFITTEESYKQICQISEVAYNELLPMLWRKIQSSKSAMKIMVERMRPYNVEIVYGCS